MIKVIIPTIVKPLFSSVIPVRISNINYGQHLGHDALISLLHEARVQCLTHLGYSELNIQGKAMLVTNLAANYHKEAFYGDNLMITIGVETHSATRIQLLYNVYNQTRSEETARAFTTIAFYDPVLSTVCKIPEALLTYISCQE